MTPPPRPAPWSLDAGIDASIVVCTRNRATALPATLESFARMTIPGGISHEVIVIDNLSTDATPSVLRDAASTLPLVSLRETGGGASAARNAGLAAARGQVILITDDDCIVAADWLAVALQLLRDNPRQVIGGRVDLFDPADLPITLKTETEPAVLASVHEVPGFIHSCNMILGREVVEAIGPFDPLLGPGTSCRGAEDADLCYRAFRADIPVSYRPELRLFHNHGRRHPDDAERLMRSYMRATGALACKYALRRDLGLLRLVYWRVRKALRQRQRAYLRSYATGFLAYLAATLGQLVGAAKR